MAPKARFATIPNTPNLRRAFQVLTDGTMTQWSGGKIPKMDAISAAGFLGALTHEHGRWDWTGLDVIEAGSGKGRGVGQFTDNWDGSAGRRTAYEAYRKSRIATGEDPNSIDFQMRYIAEEYAGKWDAAVGGKSLAGWTRIFDKPRAFKNVSDAVMYYTGSFEKREGYLRPRERTAHYDRRIDAATQIYSHLGKPQPEPQPQPQAQPAATAAPAQGPGLGIIKQTLDGIGGQILKKLGIKQGAQSFNTSKLSKTLGFIANYAPNKTTSDVGFALFASTNLKGGKAPLKNASQKWQKMDKATKSAWRTTAGQLGIASTYRPKSNISKPMSFPKNMAIKPELITAAYKPRNTSPAPSSTAVNTNRSDRGPINGPQYGDFLAGGRYASRTGRAGNKYGPRAMTMNTNNIVNRSYRGGGFSIGSAVGGLAAQTAAGTGPVANSGHTWASSAPAASIGSNQYSYSK